MKKKTETQEKKKTGGARQRILIALAVLAVAGAAAYLYFSGWINQWLGKKSTYSLAETDTVISLDAEGGAALKGFGALIVRANRSGVRASDAEGKTVWDVGFQMISPSLEAAGTYIAAADRKGSEALLISETGETVRLSADHTILFHTLNRQGKVVIVTSEEKTNTLLLFGPDGKLLLKRKTYQNKDGIPAAAAISPDGKRLVVSSISYTGGRLASILTLFDLSDKGAELVDRILASQRIENELVTDLGFCGGSCLYASESSFGAIETDKGGRLWSVRPDYQLKCIAFGENGLAVGLGERIAGVASETETNFYLYNTAGNVLYSAYLPGLQLLEYNAGIYVLGGEQRFSAVNENGKILWDYESALTLARMIPLSDRKTLVGRIGDKLQYYRVEEIQEAVSK